MEARLLDSASLRLRLSSLEKRKSGHRLRLNTQVGQARLYFGVSNDRVDPRCSALDNFTRCAFGRTNA